MQLWDEIKPQSYLVASVRMAYAGLEICEEKISILKFENRVGFLCFDGDLTRFITTPESFSERKNTRQLHRLCEERKRESRNRADVIHERCIKKPSSR